MGTQRSSSPVQASLSCPRSPSPDSATSTTMTWASAMPSLCSIANERDFGLVSSGGTSALGEILSHLIVRKIIISQHVLYKFYRFAFSEDVMCLSNWCRSVPTCFFPLSWALSIYFGDSSIFIQTVMVMIKSYRIQKFNIFRHVLYIYTYICISATHSDTAAHSAALTQLWSFFHKPQ